MFKEKVNVKSKETGTRGIINVENKFSGKYENLHKNNVFLINTNFLLTFSLNQEKEHFTLLHDHLIKTNIKMKKFKLLSLLTLLLTVFLMTSCQEDETSLIDNVNVENSLDIKSKTDNKKVTLMWDGNPKNLKSQLVKAINDVGENGTIILPNGWYKTDKPIILPEVSGVTIKGWNRNKTVIAPSKFFKGSGIIILSAPDTKFEGITVNGLNKNKSQGGVYSNGFPNAEAKNCTFKNLAYGFGGVDDGMGKPIDGMKVENCVFDSCKRGGINFVRWFHNSKVRSIDRVLIKNCLFKGIMNVGITIDCGNDGTDGVERPGMTKAVTDMAQNTVTNMNGMLIEGCTFGKAKLYNIALAKVKNVVIKGKNILKGTTGGSFTENINIEHESSNIQVVGNILENRGLESNNIAIVGFNDHKFLDPTIEPLHENGCRDIRIEQNEFRGNVQSCIAGEEAVDIFINRNNFDKAWPDNKLYINFWRNPKGNLNLKQWENKKKGKLIPLSSIKFLNKI